MRELLVIRSRVQRAMLVSIAAALLTMAVKFGAWHLTGSVGLFSDALESLVNLAAAVLGFVLLGLAAMPADDDHPYGHEKAEYFSSGAEGMMILFAALAIGWKALNGFFHPTPLQQLDIGLLLALLATAINAGAAFWLLKVARAENSIAVEADAKHLLTDVWTSLGLLLALGLMLIFPTAWWLDPLIALAVAINIVLTGFHLLRSSVDGLMDKQLPVEELQQIEDALQCLLPDSVFYSQLRTRQAGNRRFVEFNLHVPGKWCVVQSHGLCDELERAVLELFSNTDIQIHVEPIDACVH